MPDDDRRAYHRPSREALARSRQQQDAIATERYRSRSNRLGNLNILIRHGAAYGFEELRFSRDVVQSQPCAGERVRRIGMSEMLGPIRRRLVPSSEEDRTQSM